MYSALAVVIIDYKNLQTMSIILAYDIFDQTKQCNIGSTLILGQQIVTMT